MPRTHAVHNPHAFLTFETETGDVLHELRAVLAAIVEGLKPPIIRATDLRRRLGLDQSLSWSIFKAATAEDARAVASLVPGRRAFERFLAATAESGVPVATVERARAAFDRFEGLVERHARSRSAFATMVAQIGEAPQEQFTEAADARHKRFMFRGAAHLLGRQAHVAYHAIALHPSEKPGLLDRMVIRGMLGLHQTRRGVPLQTITRQIYKPTAGDPIDVTALESLEPEPDGTPFGFLRDFCSQPMPEFRPLPDDTGYAKYELVSPGLGASSQVTYFAAFLGRACVAAPGSAPDAEIVMARATIIPVETYIGDVLMHESVWDEQPPPVGVYAWPVEGPPWEFRERDRLPLSERAVHLGRGADAGRTPLVPRYSEMLAFAIRRAGWNPDEFRIFRCKVDYPMVYTRISMSFRRPVAGA